MRLSTLLLFCSLVTGWAQTLPMLNPFRFGTSINYLSAGYVATNAYTNYVLLDAGGATSNVNFTINVTSNLANAYATVNLRLYGNSTNWISSLTKFWFSNTPPTSLSLLYVTNGADQNAGAVFGGPLGNITNRVYDIAGVTEQPFAGFVAVASVDYNVNQTNSPTNFVASASGALDGTLTNNILANTNEYVRSWISAINANGTESPTIEFNGAAPEHSLIATNYDTGPAMYGRLADTNRLTTTEATYREVDADTPDPVWFVTYRMLYLTNSPATPDYRDNLLFNWSMNEGSGTTLQDDTANNIDGTIVTAGQWTTGKAGGGVTNNGVNQWIESSSAVAYGAGKLTLTTWVWINGGFSGVPVIWESSTNFDNNADVFLNFLNSTLTNTVLFKQGVGTAFKQVEVPPVTADGWHHIAVAMDKDVTGTGTLTVWYDGVEQSPTVILNQSFTPVNFATEKLYLSSRGGASNFMPATWDDFRVYNVVLTAEQVRRVVANPR